MSCGCNQYNFAVKQGADYRLTVTWKNPDGTPVNLTGRTAKMQLRVQPASDALLTLTSGAGLTLGGTAGTVGIVITAAQGLTLPLEPVLYDLLIINGTAVDRILEGVATICAGVTQV